MTTKNTRIQRVFSEHKPFLAGGKTEKARGYVNIVFIRGKIA